MNGSVIGRLVVSVMTLVAAGTVATLTFRPALPLGLQVADSLFSGERAKTYLEALLPMDEPRPTGSEGLSAFRARLSEELNHLGLDVHPDTFPVCQRNSTSCASGVNLITDLAGDARLPRTILMAHVDGVPDSPGAGDNAASVAVLLEVVRSISAGAGTVPPIRLLFTDAEELGGLGARRYFTTDTDSTALVINVDGSGTSGPSRVLRVSPGGSWLAGEMARNARRPIVNSAREPLFVIARGGTDLAHAIEAGRVGVDLTFIGSRWNWHADTDSRDSVSSATLQHHGESVRAILRGIDTGIRQDRSRDRLFATIAPGIVLSWPAGTRLYLPLILLTLGCLVCGLTGRSRAPTRLAHAGLVVAGSILLSVALGYLAIHGIGFALGGRPPYPLDARPWRLGFYVVPWLTMVTLAIWSKAERLDLTVVIALAMFLVGGALAAGGDPKFSFPFFLITSGAATGAILMRALPTRYHFLASVAVAGWISLVALPYAIIAEITYGLRSSVQILVPSAIAMSGLLPLVATDSIKPERKTLAR